jgi:hypothetical protein
MIDGSSTLPFSVPLTTSAANAIWHKFHKGFTKEGNEGQKVFSTYEKAIWKKTSHLIKSILNLSNTDNAISCEFGPGLPVLL